MELCLFDMHADTLYEMYKRKTALRDPSLHISLDRTKKYRQYLQCTAIWSDMRLSDNEAFERFVQIYHYAKAVCTEDKEAVLCRNVSDINEAHTQGKSAFLLTVEDARLLAQQLSRLDILFQCGVRMLTLQWQGESCIGGGFDTEAPLTPFGRSVVVRCAQLGIIPDISHANEITSRQIIEIAAEHGSPVIATHSNAYSVCSHKRNLTDALFDELVSMGGIVGISLAPQHLSADCIATSDDVLLHIEHYAGRAGIEHICLGCDLDGIETTPTDIQNIGELDNICECMLRHNYKESDVTAVFSENARRYISSNLKNIN